MEAAEEENAGIALDGGAQRAVDLVGATGQVAGRALGGPFESLGAPRLAQVTLEEDGVHHVRDQRREEDGAGELGLCQRRVLVLPHGGPTLGLDVFDEADYLLFVVVFSVLGFLRGVELQMSPGKGVEEVDEEVLTVL